MTFTQDLTHGDHVKWERGQGLAFWIIEPQCEDPEHHDACTVIRAVGDDYDHHADATEVHAMDSGKFCPSCGATDCDWKGTQ